MDNYNYPLGADTPDAPWNQQDPEWWPLKCQIVEVIQRNDVTIDIEAYEDDFDCNKSNIYHEIIDQFPQQHLSIQTLIDTLLTYAKNELSTLQEDDNKEHKKRRNFLNLLISDCENIDVVETEVDEFEIV